MRNVDKDSLDYYCHRVWFRGSRPRSDARNKDKDAWSTIYFVGFGLGKVDLAVTRMLHDTRNYADKDVCVLFFLCTGNAGACSLSRGRSCVCSTEIQRRNRGSLLGVSSAVVIGPCATYSG